MFTILSYPYFVVRQLLLSLLLLLYSFLFIYRCFTYSLYYSLPLPHNNTHMTLPAEKIKSVGILLLLPNTALQIFSYSLFPSNMLLRSTYKNYHIFNTLFSSPNKPIGTLTALSITQPQSHMKRAPRALSSILSLTDLTGRYRLYTQSSSVVM
jgi:hypothetical protein